MYTMQEIPVEERPRERMLKHGPESMSIAELIAIILGSGMKGCSVMQLSETLLGHFGSLEELSDATIEELCEIKGIGKIKAIQLKAMFGIIARMSRHPFGDKYRIDHPKDAYNLVKHLIQHEKREVFMVILQNAKGYVQCYETVSIGTLTYCLVHPREIFYPAIRHKSASVILVHNHPSGDPTPSKQDIKITQTLCEVGKILAIPVNDHIIVGNGSFVSLRDLGLLDHTKG